MLRRDGYAKILDFGLAKLIEPQAMSMGSQAATLTTETGMMMGTVLHVS